MLDFINTSLYAVSDCEVALVSQGWSISNSSSSKIRPLGLRCSQSSKGAEIPGIPRPPVIESVLSIDTESVMDQRGDEGANTAGIGMLVESARAGSSGSGNVALLSS